MELPNYRLPGLKCTPTDLGKGQRIHSKGIYHYLPGFRRGLFLQTFDPSLNIAESTETSLLAMIGRWIAPLFVPLGFGDWQWLRP